MNPGPWAPGRAESRRTSHPGSPRRHDLPAQRPTAPSFPLGPCFLGPQLKQGLFCWLTGCWIPSDRDRAHPLPASLDRQPPGLCGDGFPGLTLRCLQGALDGPHDPLPVPDRLAGESGSRSTRGGASTVAPGAPHAHDAPGGRGPHWRDHTPFFSSLPSHLQPGPHSSSWDPSQTQDAGPNSYLGSGSIWSGWLCLPRPQFPLLSSGLHGISSWSEEATL